MWAASFAHKTASAQESLLVLLYEKQIHRHVSPVGHAGSLGADDDKLALADRLESIIILPFAAEADISVRQGDPGAIVEPVPALVRHAKNGGARPEAQGRRCLGA
ncbi:AP-1-like transcription factor napA [Apiospora arundinis]